MSSDDILRAESYNLINDFIKVAEIVKVPMQQEQIIVEVLNAPHRRPKGLPQGKQAVYWFSIANICLKVGKAGAQSNARFTSHP